MHGVRQRFLVGLTDEKVNVLGHDHISINLHFKTDPRSFQTLEKQIVDTRRRKIGFTTIATESKKMGLPGFMESFQAARHGQELYDDLPCLSVTCEPIDCLEYSTLRFMLPRLAKLRRTWGTRPPLLPHSRQNAA